MTQPHTLQRYAHSEAWGGGGGKADSMKPADVLRWNLTVPSLASWSNLPPTLHPPPQLWHLLLLERPFTEDDTSDSESRPPGGRLGGFDELGGLGALGGGPIGGSVPAGIGGSMGGLLGSTEHWGPGRHPRLHSQRRFRSRGSSRPDRSPAVEGWATQTTPNPLTSATTLPHLLSPGFLFCMRLSVSCSSFSPACFPTLECLVLLPSHGETAATHTWQNSEWLGATSLPFSLLSSIRTGMLHSNPGDYAWGQGGLDAVITQVRKGFRLSFSKSTIYSVILCSFVFYPSLLFFSLAPHVSPSYLATLSLRSYLASWKTQDPHRQKKKRSLPSQLSVSLRNKQVSEFSPFLSSTGFLIKIFTALILIHNPKIGVTRDWCEPWMQFVHS